MRVYTGCTDVRDDFSALLDGELAADEREALEAHLSDCSDCLRALDGVKRVDTLFRKLPSVGAPKGFDASLREARKPKLLRFPTGGRSLRVASMVAAAAGLMIVAGIAFVAVRGGSPETAIGPVALERSEVSGDQAQAKESASNSAGAGVLAEDAPDEQISQQMAFAPPPAAPMREESLRAEPEADNVAAAGRSAASAPVDAQRFEVAPPLPQAASPVPAEPMPTESAEAEAVDDAAQKATALSDAPRLRSADRDAAGVASEPVPAIAERAAEFRNGVWYETGYTDQPLTDLARDSERFAGMIEADAGLLKYRDLSGAVVFQFEGDWYRLTAAE